MSNCEDCDNCECSGKTYSAGKLTAKLVKPKSDLEKKKDQILNLVSEYIQEKRLKESFTPGEDWVKYSGPYMDDKEYTAAIDSLLSEWLIFGEKAREFEHTFAPLMGKKLGVLTNSGSSANLLMWSALTSKKKMNKWHLPKGSKVLTPAVCFPTTINPIIQNGFEPVFIDVELPNLNIDLDKMEKRLKDWRNLGYEMPRAVTFAHVLGNPPDMDRLRDICDEYNLIFLEDACDALGSTYDGKPLGSFGLMSTCSFFCAHHMATGEGGFVSTNEMRLKTILDSFRDWGRDCYCNRQKPGDVTSGTACGNRFSNWLPGNKDIIFDHRYTFSHIGYNLKPLELQAAMGLEQIKKLSEMDAARRSNYKKLMDIFEPYEEFFMLNRPLPKADPCWFGFLLTVKDGAPFAKQEFVDYLEDHKIQTRSYFTGLCLYHEAYQHLTNLNKTGLKAAFPNAHKSTVDTFFLGTFIGYTDEKINYVKKVVDKFFEDLQK